MFWRFFEALADAAMRLLLSLILFLAPLVLIDYAAEHLPQKGSFAIICAVIYAACDFFLKRSK
jgi:hypothetical protein